MPRTILPVIMILLLSCTMGVAQELRIYTRVYDASQTTSEGKPPIISRSLSLFHAGKVYDYIDTVGEITIFEPAERRFTILNESRMLVTTVAFDEIRNLLKIARKESMDYVVELTEQGDSESLKVATALQFQLEPQFEIEFQPDQNRLHLRSPTLSYRVQCARPPSAELVAPCIRFADWMAQLNFVLHPRAFLPDARTMLNAELLERGLIPTEVKLHAELERPVELLAEHRIHWNLDSRDRSSIHHWQTLLSSNTITRVTFPEYQRALLSEPAAGKR